MRAPREESKECRPRSGTRDLRSLESGREITHTGELLAVRGFHVRSSGTHTIAVQARTCDSHRTGSIARRTARRQPGKLQARPYFALFCCFSTRRKEMSEQTRHATPNLLISIHILWLLISSLLHSLFLCLFLPFFPLFLARSTRFAPTSFRIFLPVFQCDRTLVSHLPFFFFSPSPFVSDFPPLPVPLLFLSLFRPLSAHASSFHAFHSPSFFPFIPCVFSCVLRSIQQGFRVPTFRENREGPRSERSRTELSSSTSFSFMGCVR